LPLGALLIGLAPGATEPHSEIIEQEIDIAIVGQGRGNGG
jgi:hypothetical protein